MKIKNDSKFHNQNILVEEKNFNLYPSKYFFFIRLKYTHFNNILPLIIWNTSLNILFKMLNITKLE